MGLRKDWSTTKGAAELLFQRDHAKELLKAHTEAPTGYPLKFKMDLGPTLDDFEKAQKANKDADVKKYSTKAKTIIVAYKKQINDSAKVLGNGPKKILLDELDKIESKLPK